MAILSWLMANGANLIAALVGVLGALILLFAMIPGPHPEDWFEKARDFLSKFSKK